MRFLCTPSLEACFDIFLPLLVLKHRGIGRHCVVRSCLIPSVPAMETDSTDATPVPLVVGASVLVLLSPLRSSSLSGCRMSPRILSWVTIEAWTTVWPACPACPALGPDFSCYVGEWGAFYRSVGLSTFFMHGTISPLCEQVSVPAVGRGHLVSPFCFSSFSSQIGRVLGAACRAVGKAVSWCRESLPVEPPAQLAASCSAVLVFFFRDPLKIENHFFQWQASMWHGNLLRYQENWLITLWLVHFPQGSDFSLVIPGI